jgi:hypothetical protein
MADDLEGYLLTQHPVDKATVDEQQRLVNDVLETFAASFLQSPGTWPYQLITGESPEVPRRLSFSTTAMIAFALGLATGRIQQSSLAPSVGDPQGSDVMRATINRLINRAMDCLARLSDDLAPVVQQRVEAGFPRPRPRPALTDSATFGWDDPFTLSWLLEVLEGDDAHARAAFREKLRRRALALVKRVAKNPTEPVLQIRPGEHVRHAFPLLRVLQLARTLSRAGDVDVARVADLSPARDYLAERVHLQLSESHIADGGFDAADLVFSLEGWIVASPVEPDLAVVEEVFRALRESQQRTPYWRPLRPFEATQQGLVLLPQSVEIANSLLRICSSPALDAREYFSRHLDLLERYTRWLLGRVFRGLFPGRGGSTFVGWESEHTYTQDRIHLWQTSQVLIFLQHYTAMLQQHVARKLMRLAPLVPNPRPPARLARPADPVVAWSDWKTGEPLTTAGPQSSYRVYQRIEEDFIAPRAHAGRGRGFVSMLLYGPPGTGKSTIAEELGRALGFPLLTVTPSDFLTAGGEAVEARAKAIFQVLAEQRDVIVLFDEIDHLLLDRDSALYRDQGDVFKLLTPGMLTKLTLLARQQRVVSVIATNYYERIDRAIKRPGRIDARYLVLPPDLRQRRRYLGKAIDGLGRSERDAAAKATVHFTYRELRELAEHVRKRQQEHPNLVLRDALMQRIREVPPMISLDAYSERLGLKWAKSRPERFDVPTVEKPWEEIALIAYLEWEARGWPSQPAWLADSVKDAFSAPGDHRRSRR